MIGPILIIRINQNEIISVYNNLTTETKVRGSVQYFMTGELLWVVSCWINTCTVHCFRCQILNQAWTSVSRRLPITANASITDDGSFMIMSLSSRSTEIKARSLVRPADIEARRWVLIGRIAFAEKLRSADAEATGTVNATLKSASRSGKAHFMFDSCSYICRVVFGLAFRNMFLATSACASSCSMFKCKSDSKFYSPSPSSSTRSAAIHCYYLYHYHHTTNIFQY